MRFRYLVLGIIGLLFISCAGVSNARTTVSPNFKKSSITKMKVAVVPGNKTEAGQYLADSIATDLLSAGFRIIERSKLTSLLAEYELSLTGLLESEDYIKIGKVVNIDALFILTEHTTRAGIIGGVNVKLIDLTTGDLIMSTSYSQPAPNNNMYLLNDTLGNTAKKVSESIYNNLFDIPNQ